LLAFSFGVVFVLTILTLSLKFPNPTPFQFNTFRTVLALAAGGVAAMIPGFLTVTVKNWVRAGGALAVFVLVYFYSPAGVATGSSPSISQHAGPGSTQIGINSGTVVISAQDKLAISILPVDIQGSWDQGAAEAMALSSLQAWSTQQRRREAEHKLLSTSDLLYKDRQTKLLAYASAGESCHPCSASLSFFEFEKRARGWKLTDTRLDAVGAGAFGQFDGDGLTIRVIADNTYGVFLIDCDMHFGFSECYQSLHSMIGDSFKQLFRLKTTEIDFNRNGHGWTSSISIMPVSTGPYDIVVDRKGTRGPRDLVVQGDEDPDFADGHRVRPKDVFKFDGKEYVRGGIFE
jgi:hypothetical protein